MTDDHGQWKPPAEREAEAQAQAAAAAVQEAVARAAAAEGATPFGPVLIAAGVIATVV